MVTDITQEQINGYRMDRHFLSSRASAEGLESVVTGVCGIQAQMPAFANLQIWARTEGLKPTDISNALWESKILLRTWCMRGTAHYITFNDFPAYLKAIIEPHIPRHKEWLIKRGMREFGEIARIDPSKQYFETILAAVTHALSNGPATREAVAKSVAQEVGPEARPWVETGYYIVTKLLAYEGKVCFGPDLDGNATLVLTEQWLSHQPPLPKQTAEDTILRNYLRCYGPGTPQDFSAWSGLKMATVKPIWERNTNHLIELRLNEKPVWLFQEDLERLLDTKINSRPARLLPHFDVFLLGHKDKSHIVDPAHYKKVFKKAAWIAPTILCEGKAIGTWMQKRTATKVVVTLEPFKKLTKSQLDDVEAEASRLGDYFDVDSKVKVNR